MEESMNVRYRILLSLLCAMLVLASACGAAEYSEQDPDLSVAPVIRLFPVTPLGGESAAASFAVTNRSAGEERAIGSVYLSGPDADQFALESDTCTGMTLPAGGSCSVSVKFRPTTRGTKGANLLIPALNAESDFITAFVSNVEDAATEAMRRMPPVLTSVKIPESMVPGATYTLEWTLEGYHAGYTSYMVLFDCTEVKDCGASYGDATRFAQSDNVNFVSSAVGNWSYDGVDDTAFSYSWNFQVPEKRGDGTDWPAEGADIVVRFYSKDDIDQERNRGSVSLLVPGNLVNGYYGDERTVQYYDLTGRRIMTRIEPGP